MVGKENRSHRLVKWETGDELITAGFVRCDMFSSLLFYDLKKKKKKENCGLRTCQKTGRVKGLWMWTMGYGVAYREITFMSAPFYSLYEHVPTCLLHQPQSISSSEEKLQGIFNLQTDC